MESAPLHPDRRRVLADAFRTLGVEPRDGYVAAVAAYRTQTTYLADTDADRSARSRLTIAFQVLEQASAQELQALTAPAPDPFAPPGLPALGLVPPRPATGYRFNPPAGWPTPPSDWSPPPGWIPPANLPPVPTGWVWWIPARDSTRLARPLAVTVQAAGRAVSSLDSRAGAIIVSVPALLVACEAIVYTANGWGRSLPIGPLAPPVSTTATIAMIGTLTALAVLVLILRSRLRHMRGFPSGLTAPALILTALATASLLIVPHVLAALPASTSTPGPVTLPGGQTLHSVRYDADGSAKTVTIEYFGIQGPTTLARLPLPLRDPAQGTPGLRTLMPPGAPLAITVTAPKPRTLTCSITVDGTQLASNTATGTSVECAAQIPVAPPAGQQ